MPVLKINFENQKALTHFATWMCESGEQAYWDWMRIREEDEEGDITVLNFDYFNDGEFMEKNVITTKCGRKDIGDQGRAALRTLYDLYEKSEIK
jgi:hypothetical protein